MSEEIREAVSGTLASAGVGYSARNMGVKENALGGGRIMDAWRVTFARVNSEAFDFYTGLGLRAPATRADKIRASMTYSGLTANDKNGLTQYGRRYIAEIEKQRKPKAPHAAEVLSALILDSSAASMSFADWCADYGYEEDSRKAFAIYEACQKSADQLRRIFPRDVLESLRVALEDF